MSEDSRAAAGLAAVLRVMRRAAGDTGALRSARLLARINQDGGFDCPGCAWPESGDRSFAEFCENGAKAVAHEATRARVGAAFFREHSVADLLAKDDHWLEAQGRLEHPMHRAPGARHFEPIAWEDAFVRIGRGLRALASPDEAVFYTSGRTSNEAAFLYQLFVRELGTNNLPDCSNMCHESSGTGLGETIGVGKGTVDLEDFAQADAIFVLGQNPGTNHPRMMTTLQRAKERGCRIVSINPLRELGLLRFSNPQRPLDLLGHSTELSDLYLQVRIGGDIALLEGIMKIVLEAEDAAPGTVLDHAFLREHTSGFDELREHLRAARWEDLEEESGLSRALMHSAADVYLSAKNVIACWAMGLTQHRHGVANIREITNLLLLRGHLGRPGAGLCPVRGHSNVQGDRTMGIWEKPREEFLARLDAEFGIRTPREHGMDTVATLQAMLAGRVKVFVAMGGNFAAATPDSTRAVQALARCGMAVHVATKLNRTHLVGGEEAFLLPTLGRTERDLQAGGRQFVTVEDSMSMVHRSEGTLAPASEHLRSEPSIVAGLARATLGDSTRVPWEELVADYDRIRDRIERVVPGFERFNERVREENGFRLPNAARERRFATGDGKARFTVNALTGLRLADGEFLLMTIRSHDQFNTTVYGKDDLYRGIRGERDVLFMNREDANAMGLAEGDRVDVTSLSAAARPDGSQADGGIAARPDGSQADGGIAARADGPQADGGIAAGPDGPQADGGIAARADGSARRLEKLRVVLYDIPRRCLAAYFPEANVLVALEDFAEGSRTPAYKSIRVTLSRSVG